ncbi:hypothetical protein D3C86_1691720 [compost metagenome]
MSRFSSNETIIDITIAFYQNRIYGNDFLISHHNSVANCQFGEQNILLFSIEINFGNGNWVKRFVISVVRKRAVRSLLEHFSHQHKEEQTTKRIEIAWAVICQNFINTSAVKYEDSQYNRNINVDDFVLQTIPSGFIII